MVYEKYVLGLAWRIELFPRCTAQLPEPDKHQQATEASLVMLKSLSLWLQVRNSILAVLRPYHPVCHEDNFFLCRLTVVVLKTFCHLV